MGPRSAAEASPEFRAELESINLNRLRWFQIVCAVAAVLFLISCGIHQELKNAETITHALVDFVVVLVMLALTLTAQKRPPGSSFRGFVIWTAIILFLAGMQVWYFTGLSEFGQTPNYILSIVAAAALVLLPPRSAWLLLAINHLVYCYLAFALKLPSALFAATLSDGTFGVLVAGVLSRLLYRNKLADFQQRQVILAKNAELEELMVIAAHDLRSPLLGVRDMLNLGKKNLQDSAFLERMLQHTSKTCSELETLIGRMIEAHRAEHQSEKALVEEDLRLLVQASVDRLKPVAAAKKIELLLELPSAPAPVRLDRDVFGQALDNLLGNAVKYSPFGKKAGVRLQPGDQCWLVDVWDEGPGVPEDEESLLFKKFQRGSAVPTAGENSAGLGLFIVKTLAESMNGHVTYRPNTPAGACFRLEIRS